MCPKVHEALDLLEQELMMSMPEGVEVYQSRSQFMELEGASKVGMTLNTSFSYSLVTFCENSHEGKKKIWGLKV